MGEVISIFRKKKKEPKKVQNGKFVPLFQKPEQPEFNAGLLTEDQGKRLKENLSQKRRNKNRTVLRAYRIKP